jgi:quercetin dioxygenase-like cupin family protein
MTANPQSGTARAATPREQSHLPAGEVSAIWFLGTLTSVKATGESTNGAFGLIEQLIPAGFASPYHVHHAEDEAFYVLEGELTFISEGRKSKAGPSAYIFGPREIPHGFRVEGNAPARVLVLTVPAGFERFVVEMGEPANEPVLPPPAPPDMAKLMALAAKYRIDILGPLPG